MVVAGLALLTLGLASLAFVHPSTTLLDLMLRLALVGVAAGLF